MHHRMLLLHLQCHGEITLTEQRASNLLTAFWHELCPALGHNVSAMLQRPCWDGAEQGTKLRSLIFLISEADSGARSWHARTIAQMQAPAA